MKVGIKLVKVKKFGICWCIPHRVVADNSKGGFVRTPPPGGIGLRRFGTSMKSQFPFQRRSGCLYAISF